MKEISFFLLAVGISFGVAGCRSDKNPRKTLGPQPVHTLQVLRRPITTYETTIQVKGNPIPLGFKEAGSIKHIRVVEGESVEKGRVLAKLKGHSLQAYHKAKKALAYAQENKTPDEEKKRLELAFSFEKEKLQRLKLQAPLDGTIEKIVGKEGMYIDADQTLLYLQAINDLFLVLELKREELQKWMNKKVRMVGTSKKVPGQYFSLSLDEPVDTSAIEGDPVRVKLAIETKQGKGLLAGMPVSILILPSEKYDKASRLTVPVGAVVADPAGRPQVWLVDPLQGIVTSRLVKTGRIEDNRIHIFDGLNEGEQIVINYVDEMYNGKKVKILFNEMAFVEGGFQKL